MHGKVRQSRERLGYRSWKKRRARQQMIEGYGTRSHRIHLDRDSQVREAASAPFPEIVFSPA
jgi:hypothetical protein